MKKIAYILLFIVFIGLFTVPVAIDWELLPSRYYEGILALELCLTLLALFLLVENDLK